MRAEKKAKQIMWYEVKKNRRNKVNTARHLKTKIMRKKNAKYRRKV